MIQIPKEYLVDSIDTLISKVFPGMENGYMDKYFVARWAILTPTNENVDKLNEMIMERFPGEGKIVLSADTVAEEDLQNAYPTYFQLMHIQLIVNSITLSGMPPHLMTLKVGAPVILLRNLRAVPGNWLRNGTRLIILIWKPSLLCVQSSSCDLCGELLEGIAYTIYVSTQSELHCMGMSKTHHTQWHWSTMLCPSDCACVQMLM